MLTIFYLKQVIIKMYAVQSIFLQLSGYNATTSTKHFIDWPKLSPPNPICLGKEDNQGTTVNLTCHI